MDVNGKLNSKTENIGKFVLVIPTELTTKVLVTRLLTKSNNQNLVRELKEPIYNTVDIHEELFFKYSNEIELS